MKLPFFGNSGEKRIKRPVFLSLTALPLAPPLAVPAGAASLVSANLRVEYLAEPLAVALPQRVTT